MARSAAGPRALLEETGAILSGHFLLTSGRHSDTYVEKARVLERPVVTMRLAQDIAGMFERIEAVLSPAVGAIPLGFAVAHAAGARFLYAEREDGRMTLRRGFALAPAERVLVVEDVVTTGGSAAEVLGLARAAGAKPLGVAALVDRTNVDPGFALRALVRIDARSYDPNTCPLCRAGVPLTERGSRSL